MASTVGAKQELQRRPTNATVRTQPSSTYLGLENTFVPEGETSSAGTPVNALSRVDMDFTRDTPEGGKKP